jgi:acetyl esterase/lipase
MDALPAFGTAISANLMQTFKTFVPLLLANGSAIKSTKRETFTYGPNSRQALDVYYPSSPATSKTPIFTFFYGGGLVRGDKISPMMPDGLVYANLGHFFAETLGAIVVIPDYRLIDHGAVFPSGGEDVELAVRWIKEKFGGTESKPRELFMMGNSAGGIHLSTWLYSAVFAKSTAEVLSADASLRLKGVVMLSVPFHFRAAAADRADVLKTYYGDEKEEHCPLGLFESLTKNGADTGALEVPTLVLNGTLDPQDEILDPLHDYLQAWKAAPAEAQKLLKAEMMEGQNHISPVLSIGTGKKDEEAWGHQVCDWVKSI